MFLLLPDIVTEVLLAYAHLELGTKIYYYGIEAMKWTTAAAAARSAQQKRFYLHYTLQLLREASTKPLRFK